MTRGAKSVLYTDQCYMCNAYPPNTYSLKQYVNGRPHLNASGQTENIFCLCEPCDAAMEETVAVEFPGDYELCNCDIRTRWICLPCGTKEAKSTKDYYESHTEFEYYGEEETKWMYDHQHARSVCPCPMSIPPFTLFLLSGFQEI